MLISSQDLAGVKLSFIAGTATGFGAIFGVLLIDTCSRKERGVNSVLAFSLALAAGVMVSVSMVDLWWPLVQEDGVVWPSLFVILGGVLFRLLSNVVASHTSTPHLLPITTTGSATTEDHLNRSKIPLPQAAKQRNLRVALTMFLTLTLHNLPEGLAVSLSNTASESLGLTLAIAIAFHNFPEGLAIAVPYYAATGSRMGAVGLGFLSGLSEPFGALVAVLFLGPLFRSSSQAPKLLPYSLCLVGGIMISSAVLELMPEARSHGREDLVVGGGCVGVVTMLLTIWVAG